MLPNATPITIAVPPMKAGTMKPVHVIGGGLANEWDTYIAPAIARMRTQAFAPSAADTRIVPPALGANAGALGAVALATTLA